VIDWRNQEAADYYVNHVIGLATATDKHIDGVFVDSGFPIAGSTNLTYASRKACEYDVACLVLASPSSRSCCHQSTGTVRAVT